MRKLKTKTGKPLSPTYLKTIHGQLSTIFNHAVKYYDLSINPARKSWGTGRIAIGKRVGHSAEKITYRYAHLFPSVQQDMAEQWMRKIWMKELNEVEGGLAKCQLNAWINRDVGEIKL